MTPIRIIYQHRVEMTTMQIIEVVVLLAHLRQQRTVKCTFLNDGHTTESYTHSYSTGVNKSSTQWCLGILIANSMQPETL